MTLLKVWFFFFFFFSLIHPRFFFFLIPPFFFSSICETVQKSTSFGGNKCFKGRRLFYWLKKKKKKNYYKSQPPLTSLYTCTHSPMKCVRKKKKEKKKSLWKLKSIIHIMYRETMSIKKQKTKQTLNEALNVISLSAVIRRCMDLCSSLNLFHILW